MPIDNQKILITGATGFLGSYLLRLLVHLGYTNIVAVKRSTSSMDLVRDVERSVDWITVDILDFPYLAEAFEGVDIVFHCAAKISFQPSERKEMFEINIEGTKNIVNLCLVNGIKKLIHVSSTAAIGRTKPGQIIDEKSKWNRSHLNSNYAVSKYLAEQEVWRGMAEGLNIAIVNPSIILGSGFWEKGTQMFFKLAYESFPYYPLGLNGFVDVRDVAVAMVKLLTAELSGIRLIISSENITYKKLLELIAGNLSTRPASKAVGPIIQFIAWRWFGLLSVFTGKKPFITKETTLNSAHNYPYANQKSVDLLNINYRPIEKTIKQTSSQFLEAAKQSFKPLVLPFNEDEVAAIGFFQQENS